MANKKVSQLTSKPSVLTTDLFPIADPSTGQLFKTTISDLGTAIGSGVSSVNGLVGAVVLDTDDIQELVSPTNKWFTDTRARAALSASSPLTYNSGTGVFGIQVATSTQNGYLSSADWTTFNAKQAALSGTGFVKSTGGTISYDTNTYLTTSSAASTYLALAGGTMTGALFGASASFSGYVGFNGNTSPLYPVDVAGSGRFSGDLRIESTNPRIYLTDTDNNPDYFISNTDGTFTVYDVTNSTARFTIGTTGNATFTNAITGGGSITGQSLYSNGIISAGSSVTATRLILSGGTGNTGLYFGHTDRVVLANYGVGGIDFEVNSGTIVATLFPSGNFGLGIALDAGYKLDVNGTARISGALSGTSAMFSAGLTLNRASAGAANGYVLQTSGTSNWYVGSSAIGANSDFQVYNHAAAGVVFNIANSSGAATFSSSVTATQGIFQNGTSGTTISATNTGGGSVSLGISSNATSVATLAFTNSLSLTGGNVGIGTTSPGTKLHLISALGTDAFAIGETGSNQRFRIGQESSYTGNYINSTNIDLKLMTYADGGSGGTMMFYTSTNTTLNERMRITSGGNVGIGLTSPARRLTVSAPSGDNAEFTNGVDADLVVRLSSGVSLLSPSTGILALGTSSTERMRIKSNGIINFSNVPTSSAGLSSGDVYKTVAGVLMIV